MKRALAFSLLILGSAIVLAAEKTKVVDLLDNPTKFDGKSVSVSGTVKKFKAKESKAGNKYFTFDLIQEDETVHVYGQGELDPAPKNGDKVELTGKFAKLKKVGDLEFKNEIDITPKKGEKYALKILK